MAKEAGQALDCAVGVNAEPQSPRHVNLVLDDSGSMFIDGTTSLDRWSNAKYSLEVFASMLGNDDTLNVYRMSDFADGKTAGPATSVTGAEPVSSRVAKIHEMQMRGGGTPYAAVTSAVADLEASSTPDRWLVILTDGEFNDRTSGEVQRDLTEIASKNPSDGSSLRVGFLALGDEAPKVKNNPQGGIFFEHVRETEDLLSTMTGFSNRIFARSVLPQSTPGQINPDVDMDQILVFAQGENVTVGDLTSGGENFKPTSEVVVAWADNEAVENNGVVVPAVPNTGLQGTLAAFEDIPAGTGAVELEGAQTVDMFYTPRAAFGIELRDSEGAKVEADKIVGGEYTVNYGFMDRDCEFIDSDLFGEVTYKAQVTQNGEVVSDAFAPGDVIALERGDARFSVEAGYLTGNTSAAEIDLRVLRPAKPTAFEFEPTTFLASELEKANTAHGMQVKYAINENGDFTDFSEEEWASFTAESFTVTSPEPNIEFEVELGDGPGELTVHPRAPHGEPIEAATGEIPLTIEASHVYDEQLNEASLDTTVEIVDDFTFWERAAHWLKTVGWIWLLAAFFVIWMLGYVVRPTFSRRIKSRPAMVFKPKSRGKRSQLHGKFERDRLAALIPYRARTGTLQYAARGFAPMKLRAKRQNRIEVINWEPIAKRANVRINGELLDSDTTKPPQLRPSSSITAFGQDGSYDLTLNV